MVRLVVARERALPRCSVTPMPTRIAVVSATIGPCGTGSQRLVNRFRTVHVIMNTANPIPIPVGEVAAIDRISEAAGAL